MGLGSLHSVESAARVAAGLHKTSDAAHPYKRFISIPRSEKGEQNDVPDATGADGAEVTPLTSAIV
jgi:hypothetical protein